MVIDWDTRLTEQLAAVGKDICQSCSKTVDRADVGWNNADTEAGTPFTYVSIICQKCGTEIVSFNSWWPGADSFEDLVENVIKDILNDLKRNEK